MKVLRAITSALKLQMIAVVFLVAPTSWAEPQDSPSPKQVVSDLHEALIKSMQEGPKLGHEGRYELLAPVVDRTHDLDFIARTTLGANWTLLDAEQQRTFQEVFRKLSISTYAEWFKGYEDERFEFIEQQSMPRDQILIRSKLILPTGEPVRFDYILRNGKEGWRIVNILADGVSDLALKRVEYRAIFQRDGFATLVDMLKKKITLAEQG